MWPKALAQLIELAPHISRVLPMADRFFQSKATAEENQRAALDALSEGLRAELRQLTTATGQLASGIEGSAAATAALTQRMERIANDAQQARFAAESLDGRIGRLETRQSRVTTLLGLLCVLVLIAIVLLILAVVHTR